jgi:hypothetical protein
MNIMLEWLRCLLVPGETRVTGKVTLASDNPRSVRRPRAARLRREEPWDPQAVELYHSLIRMRMSEQACPSCGSSLETASLVGVGRGSTLDGFGLSDAAAARLLAYTQPLSVLCPQCKTEAKI